MTIGLGGSARDSAALIGRTISQSAASNMRVRASNSPSFSSFVDTVTRFS